MTRRCRHSRVGAEKSSHRSSPVSASGLSPTTSYPPTWSRGTAGSRRLPSGRGRRCSSNGDLQIRHVFVDGDEVTGVIDWSEASQGDALFDLATLTLAHEEHLDDVLAGYGAEVDVELIRAWWSLRCLLGIRWLVEHGFGPLEEMPEISVNRASPLGLAGINLSLGVST